MKWLYNTHLSTRIIPTIGTAASVVIASGVVIGNEANEYAAATPSGLRFSAGSGSKLKHLNPLSRSITSISVVSAGSANETAAIAGAAEYLNELTDRLQRLTARFKTNGPEQSQPRVWLWKRTIA